MAQQQAQQVANLLGRVARWSAVLGIGGSALQASLFTGEPLEIPPQFHGNLMWSS